MRRLFAIAPLRLVFIFPPAQGEHAIFLLCSFLIEIYSGPRLRDAARDGAVRRMFAEDTMLGAHRASALDFK